MNHETWPPCHHHGMIMTMFRHDHGMAVMFFQPGICWPQKFRYTMEAGLRKNCRIFLLKTLSHSSENFKKNYEGYFSVFENLPLLAFHSTSMRYNTALGGKIREKVRNLF